MVLLIVILICIALVWIRIGGEWQGGARIAAEVDKIWWCREAKRVLMIAKAGPAGPCIVNIGHKFAFIPALSGFGRTLQVLQETWNWLLFLQGCLYLAESDQFFFIPAWFGLFWFSKWANFIVAHYSWSLAKSGPTLTWLKARLPFLKVVHINRGSLFPSVIQIWSTFILAQF